MSDKKDVSHLRLVADLVRLEAWEAERSERYAEFRGVDALANGSCAEHGQPLDREESARVVCPKCGRVRPVSYEMMATYPCCNPECEGDWGTGCYHCHHPSFLGEVQP